MNTFSAGTAGLHVAVTGASGLIGSALARRLAAEGHRVSPLVRRPAGPGEINWDPAHRPSRSKATWKTSTQ